MLCQLNVAERDRDRTKLRRTTSGVFQMERGTDRMLRSLEAMLEDSLSLSLVDPEVDELLLPQSRSETQ